MIRSLLFKLLGPQCLPGSYQTCLPVLCQHLLLSFSSHLGPTPKVLVVMIRGLLGEARPFWESLCVSCLCSGEVTERRLMSCLRLRRKPCFLTALLSARILTPGALIKALHFYTQRYPGTASDFIFFRSFSALVCLSIFSDGSKRLPLLH